VCARKNMHCVMPSFIVYAIQEFTTCANPICTMHVNPFCTVCDNPFCTMCKLKETDCRPDPKISSGIIIIDFVTIQPVMVKVMDELES
jgi:hypothetical protein